MLRNIKNRTKGFTIIEVMIVLAIAALIMLIVLIAVPQLQKNQRNAARRDILGRIKTEVDNFTANNNGNIPTGGTGGEFASTAGTFYVKYLSSNLDSFKDPRTGAYTDNVTTGSVATTDDLDDGTVYYIVGPTGTICSGEGTTTTGANPRNYALLVGLEGGSTFCVDNR